MNNTIFVVVVAAKRIVWKNELRTEMYVIKIEKKKNKKLKGAT